MICPSTQIDAGYLHRGYAYSLEEFGKPRLLPASNGWILQRQIPGFADCDAMGCYPLFCCTNWSRLGEDIADLGDSLVTLGLVTDPFAPIVPGLMEQHFDVVLAYKDHYVADLTRPVDEVVSKRHRKHARRALKQLDVEVCACPGDHLDTFADMSDCLIQRHQIVGMSRFSRRAFAAQLDVPGATLLLAKHENTVVGVDLIYVVGEYAYAHLAGFSEDGYRLGAPYAVKWVLLEYLKDSVHWLDLGGSAGVDANGDDGLAYFKRGWCNETRKVYFCGRILNPCRYAEINAARGTAHGGFFPAYRQGEFG